MSGPGQTAANIMHRVSDTLSPGEDEKLVFRRFPGQVLRDAVINNQPVPTNQIDTVVLRVNPQQISFQRMKIINKVQTNAPGRFVVFDWGTDLLVLGISGNTGNLLPDAVTSGTNPINTLLETTVAAISPTAANQAGQKAARGVAADVSTIIQKTLMGSLTYFELLNMSPKFITFKRLEKMFELSDADSDVITLEIGDKNVYRGYFDEFTFDIVAESPWNWKYNIKFTVLADLSAPITRWDEQYNSKNTNLQSAVDNQGL